MAERVIRVCDICGQTAEQSVTFKLGARSLAQDLCDTHVQDLVRHSHPPKRGRRPGSSSASSPSSATPASGRRTGGRAKAAAPAKAGASKPRRKITDPAILEKRRAALAKARQVRAEKRAAAAAAAQ
jgi:hypothetical protein